MLTDNQTISRRKLLAAMGGMTGAAIAAAGLLASSSTAIGSHGSSVTHSVYGEDCDGPGNGVYNVQQYGAIGDGSHDDTAAVQAALDAAHAEGGGTVIFPSGVYRISSVTCYDEIRLKSMGGATLKIAKGAQGLTLDNARRVIIEGFRFDCSLQNSPVGAEETCITGTNAQYVLIRDCELFGGVYGIWLHDAKNGCVERCHGHHFAQWPFAVTGCEGFRFDGNVAHDNGNDGLKFAGVNISSPPNLIKDIVVTNNLCYNNARDGLDIAGNNVENVEIYGNIFRDNTLQGIDCKIVYQGQYMRNVVIRDNLLLFNQTGQMNCQNNIDTVQSSVVVYNNTVNSGAASPVYSYIYGIRIRGQGAGTKVYQNHINGCYFGIRVHDGNDAVISQNTIHAKNTGIFVELQTAVSMDGNCLEENDIHTKDSFCIHVKNPGTTNTVVRKNKMKTDANVYRTADTGTATVMYGNEIGYASSMPAGRATQGEIVWNTSPLAAGCMGWIASTTAEHAVFKPFSPIGP